MSVYQKVMTFPMNHVLWTMIGSLSYWLVMISVVISSFRSDKHSPSFSFGLVIRLIMIKLTRTVIFHFFHLSVQLGAVPIILCPNALRLSQNGHHFADNPFKCIFVNENEWILINISLKFVPKGSITNIPWLVQIMTWRRPGDKPLFKAMMV